MTRIDFQDGMIVIDAGIVAEALGISPDHLRRQMREGTITSRHERGEGADSGRSRLTFYSGRRRIRLIVDADGAIVKRSAINFADPPRPRVTAQIDTAPDQAR